MFAKALINPYEPGRVAGGPLATSVDDRAFLVPYRLDWLTFAAIAACLDGQAVSRFVVDSTSASLKQPDPQQQLERLQVLENRMNAEPRSIAWIQSEFAAELEALQASPHTEVAELSARLTTRSLNAGNPRRNRSAK